MPTGHASAFLSGNGALTTIGPYVHPATELTYFEVSGNFYDVESPATGGHTNLPYFNVITGLVIFYPRVPVGFITYVQNLDLGAPVTGDTAIALAPITARILSGQLQTINGPDTPNIQLLANSPALNLAAQGISSLIYDVQITKVVYSGVAQTISNFAFTAPTNSTPICLTDPNLTRLTYGGPT